MHGEGRHPRVLLIKTTKDTYNGFQWCTTRMQIRGIPALSKHMAPLAGLGNSEWEVYMTLNDPCAPTLDKMSATWFASRKQWPTVQSKPNIDWIASTSERISHGHLDLPGRTFTNEHLLMNTHSPPPPVPWRHPVTGTAAPHIATTWFQLANLSSTRGEWKNQIANHQRSPEGHHPLVQIPYNGSS
mgnify:CR=1 FL=1